MCGLFGCMAMGPAAPRPVYRGPGPGARAARGGARPPARGRAAPARAVAGRLVAGAARWGHVAGALFSTMARLDIYTCDVS